jgi:fused signal recognition particle receptor
VPALDPELWIAAAAAALALAGAIGALVVRVRRRRLPSGAPAAPSPGAAPAPPAAAERPASAPAPRAEPVAAEPARVPAGAEAARRERELERGLRRTRASLLGGIERLLRGRPALDAAVLEEIEALLFAADIGARTAADLLEAARRAGDPALVREALERRALELLRAATPPAQPRTPAPGTPRVVLVVGVNGSGKTTSIGKLAARWTAEGRKVLVAAADTFRAAATEQLCAWAERAGAVVVRGAPGGDPAAVAFAALERATAQGVDDVLIDTAGRLQSHAGLMDELTKIGRVVRRHVAGAPHEILLVIDANTGQNGLRQAQEFTRAAGVTGIVLAKLDGTARGGVVLGIAQELGVPVRYVGVGEGQDDLVDFEPEAFVHALFAPHAEALQPAGGL